MFQILLISSQTLLTLMSAMVHRSDQSLGLLWRHSGRQTGPDKPHSPKIFSIRIVNSRHARQLLPRRKSSSAIIINPLESVRAGFLSSGRHGGAVKILVARENGVSDTRLSKDVGVGATV